MKAIRTAHKLLWLVVGLGIGLSIGLKFKIRGTSDDDWTSSTPIFLSGEIDRVTTTGEPILIDLQVYNTGPGSAEYSGRDFPFLQIWISDENGNHLSYTSRGGSIFGSPDPNRDGKAFILKIPSGESVSINCDLVDSFQFPGPGRYWLNAKLLPGIITENGNSYYGGDADCWRFFEIADGAYLAEPQNVLETENLILSWTDFGKGTGYLVERSTKSAKRGFVQIASLSAEKQSYTDQGLDKDVPYWYRVKSGDSVYTNVVSATIEKSTAAEMIWTEQGSAR